MELKEDNEELLISKAYEIDFYVFRVQRAIQMPEQSMHFHSAVNGIC